MHRVETAYRAECLAWAAAACGGGAADWFLEPHAASPAAAAAARGRVVFAAVEGITGGGVGCPLAPAAAAGAPPVPHVLVVDASFMDGHFNVVLVCNVVAEEGAAAAAVDACPVRPGCYAVIIDSLWPKCKAAWKYAGVVDAARLAVASVVRPAPAGAAAAAADAAAAGGGGGGAGAAAAAGVGVAPAPPPIIEACPQCRGPLWPLPGLEGGGGVHMHVLPSRYEGSTLPGF